MKLIKTGNVMVCEYIAQGSRGKHNLVNVYSGDILVADFPAQFPASFYIELDFDANRPNDLDLELFIGKTSKAKIRVFQGQFESGKIGVIIVPQLVLKFDNESHIRIVASCDGYNNTTILKKKVSQGPIPA